MIGILIIQHLVSHRSYDQFFTLFQSLYNFCRKVMSLVKIISLVFGLYTQCVPMEWTSAKPTQIPGAPWLASLAQWEWSQYVMMYTKFWNQRKDISLFLPKKLNEPKSILGVMRSLLRSVVVLVALVHKLFCWKEENFPLLSIACTQLNRVANSHLTWLTCWGVHGAVYLTSIPIPSCLQAL